MFLMMRKLAGAVVMTLVLGACSNPADPEPEAEVETARIIMGADTVLVSSNGTVTGGPIVIGIGNTAFSVEWLKADGSIETLADPSDYQLEVESDNTGVVTFSRTSAFAGNLVGVSAGSTFIDVGLLHIDEGHEDFGPHPVPVVVS
jgi:hypothetical protein